MREKETGKCQWSRKALKTAAKANIRKNYIAYFAVCFIMVFIGGQYSGTIQFISSYDRENVADIRYGGDFKRDVIEDLKRNRLSADEISEKYDIGDAEAVSRWEKIYDEQGAEALNAKEISLFNTGQESSNWNVVKRAAVWVVGAQVDIEDAAVRRNEKAQQSIADVFDGVTKSHSSKFKFINAVLELLSKKSTWEIALAFSSSVFSILVSVFVANMLIAGERRFFLESRTYHGTGIGRMGFLYKERCFKPAKTMLLKDFYWTLWLFTVAGGFVKAYEYKMIPYILAENPHIDSKHAFCLSRRMMKGNKMKAFVLSLSYWNWYAAAVAPALLISFIFLRNESVLLSVVVVFIFTGVVRLAFLNPYMTASETELYIILRRKAIKEKYEFYEDLNDKYLDLDLLEEQLCGSDEDSDCGTAGKVIIPDDD